MRSNRPHVFYRQDAGATLVERRNRGGGGETDKRKKKKQETGLDKGQGSEAVFQLLGYHIT